MTYDSALSALRDSLNDLRDPYDTCTVIPEFCRMWRIQQPLLAALPPRYAQVMEDLLGRLEAGSLFTEESCSFSREDLRTHLAAWLDKAEQALKERT